VADRESTLDLLPRALGRERLPHIYKGCVGRDFAPQKVLAAYAEELLGQAPGLASEPGRYLEVLSALGDLYCQGYELPWERLPGEERPARIALPTYPFAREHCWISGTEHVAVAGGTALHPLLHRNTSNLSQQRFTTTFTGVEPLLADHVVQGARVLPGVAYLEMARAAVAQSSAVEPAQSIRLENVVFARPFAVSAPRTLTIALALGESGEIAYDIASDDELHSQGIARIVARGEAAAIDVAALRAQCANGPSAEACYDAFRAIGLEYGPAHRGLRSVAVGRGLVVADVALPESVAANGYVLHPSLLDAALQGAIALDFGHVRPLLPYAIDAIDIVSAPPAAAVAVIREATTSDALRKLDVDLCDAAGNVCVRIEGFSARLVAETRPAVVEQPIVEETLAADTFEERTIEFLKRVVARTLKIDPRRIDPAAPFEKFGIDSIVVMQLTGELEKSFGSLAKTLFFEYQTLRALAGYFLAEHRGALARQLGGDSAAPAAKPEPAALVVREEKRRVRQTRRVERAEEIAIVGVAGRYPQAKNLAAFWENLRAGRDCITEIPKERWDAAAWFDPEKGKPGKSFSKWGGFIDGVDEFDPLFFNISPRDAEVMDPQERLFLQCVYETLEDAGYTRESLSRRAGVYVGVMYEEYQLFGAQAQTLGHPLALFGSPASIANRVS